TLGENERRAYQAEVGEGLREVAQLAAGDRVELLREQPDVVPEVEEPLEQLARLVLLPLQRKHLDEPERAREEHTLPRRQAVDLAVRLRPVAEDEAAQRELLPDRLDRGDEALVGRRQEPDERHQQHTRVELVRAV